MAANDEGKSYYGIGLDNSQLRADANRASNILKGIGDSAEAEGARIDNAYKKIAGAVGGYFTLSAAKTFISDIVKVRGEVESLSISFETLLGNKQKADALFGQIKEFAAKTPLELAPLAKGAQTLLSFNIEAEKVMPLLKQIGDISMGNQAKFDSLTLAFSQMSSTGKLMGQDLLQMINAGFNPLSVIAEKTGKSIGTLKEEMSNGAISAEMVADAFASAAGEGGKFYGMLEKQSKGIEGSISNLHGAIDDMMNDLGTKGQGLITSTISGATSIVEHYEEIGKAIADIVVAYGSYKAALITLNTINQVRNKLIQQSIAGIISESAALGTRLSVEQATAIAKTRTLTLAQQGLVKSLQAVKATMLSNPYTFVAVAVASLAFGIYKLVTAETAAEAAQRKHNEAMEAAREKKENLISKTQQLTNKINDETQTIYAQIKAWEELQKEMPDAFAGMTMQDFKNMKPEDREKLINKTADEKEIAELNKDLETAQKRVESLKNSINDAVTMPSGQFGNGGVILALGRQLTEAEKTLKLKKEEKEQRDEIIRQAEFEAKSDSEKLSILNEQLQKYKDQYAEIEKLVPESERIAETMDKTVTPSITSVEKGLFDVNTEWGKFDWQTMSNISQLDFLKGKINEVGSTISSITTANSGGTTYAEAKENARKAYSEAKKLVDDITKNSKKYSQKAYEDAVENLDKTQKAYKSLGGDITKSAKTPKEKLHDYTEQIKKEEQERVKAYKDLEFSVEQARINSMNEGSEKVLAQNKLNYEKEVEEINRQKADMLKQMQDWEKTIWQNQNPNWEKKEMKFTPTITSLSENDNQQFEALKSGALKEFEAANKKVLDELIAEFGSYQQKRVQIAEQWEAKIAQLPVEYQAEAAKQMHNALADLDSEYNHTTTAITALFGDMSDKSVAEMRKMAKEAEAMKNFVLDGEWDAGKGKVFGITESQFKSLNEEWAKSPEKLSAIKKEIRDLNRTADSSENAFKKLSKGIEDVFTAGDDKEKSKEGLASLEDGLGQILSLAQTVGDSITTIFEAFGNEEAADLTANITKLVGGVGQAGMGVAKLASGDIIGGISDLASGLTNVVTSLINIGDAKREKEIKRLQGQVEILESSYEKLAKAIDKAYSANAANLIEQQDANLRQQKKIIEQQKRAEDEKKKTDKGKIKQYNDAIKEIDDELEKTQGKVIEAIIGEDVSSAIDEFADAYLEAWAGGEDKAVSMKEVVRKMIKSAVSELVKSRLSKEVTAFMNYLATAMEDGILTIAEENTLNALEAAIYNKLNGLDASLDKYVKDKQEEKEDEGREATKKGFDSMSQDSANELNGRFTAVQAHTFSINENTKLLVANSNRILEHLAGIHNNTDFCRRLDGMDADLRSVKNGIDDINLKGITLKK